MVSPGSCCEGFWVLGSRLISIWLLGTVTYDFPVSVAFVFFFLIVCFRVEIGA